ncbi:Hypothetical_protein [Hexamita inflata]|uniref:Hypothetical_protein n=1 Tax=Hexamita inflata TaxID=28002 RepID=A0ABP1GIJ9_9EUKA
MNFNRIYRNTPVRHIMTPLNIYNKPVLHRTLAYLGISLLSVGIALMVIFSTNQDQLGLMVGGLICLFFGTVLGMVSLVSCRVVQSVKYIMMPCCMSETDRKTLEEQAMTRTPMLNGVPVVLSHQQVRVNQYQMNHEQVQINFQQSGQVQPNVLVQPMIQENVQQPAQITAPVQMEISPVM